MNASIIIILIIIIILLILLSIIVIKTTTDTTTDTTTQLTPNEKALQQTLQNAETSPGATFTPNYVPPDPVSEETLLGSLFNALGNLIEMVAIDEAFTKFLTTITPKELQTWKSIFGNNSELQTALKKTRSVTLKNVSKTLLSQEKDPLKLIQLGSNDLVSAKISTDVAERAAVDAEENISETVLTRFAATVAERLDPITAALVAITIAGTAMDFANVDQLQDWQQQTTGVFDQAKTTQDSIYAQNANSSQIKLPLISGPLDSSSTDTLDAIIQYMENQYISGTLVAPDQSSQRIIQNIQNSILTNFLGKAAVASPGSLRGIFSISTLSSLTDEQTLQLSQIALKHACSLSNGTLINGTYCSKSSQSNCNFTDNQWEAFDSGNYLAEYTEWRTSQQIQNQFKVNIDEPGACLVLPFQVRDACKVGRWDINGNMHYNQYDPTTGRCFNTQGFCAAYGVQWDETNRTCKQNNTEIILATIFGNTIVQGVSMLSGTISSSVIHTLEKQGPAGKFIASILQANLISDGQIICAYCTIITDEFHIVKDFFTGNWHDLVHNIENEGIQFKNIGLSIGGFFNAIIQDFENIF
jgi:hypothetical protein